MNSSYFDQGYAKGFTDGWLQGAVTSAIGTLAGCTVLFILIMKYVPL